MKIVVGRVPLSYAANTCWPLLAKSGRKILLIAYAMPFPWAYRSNRRRRANRYQKASH
jgi:hypothetical protein